MKKIIWKMLIILGVCPFIVPFVLGAYRMSIESWTWESWLILYSFIYWPTYVLGLVLIVIGVVQSVREKSV